MNFVRGFACALALFAQPFARAAALRLEASTAWAENIDRASGPTDWRDAWRHSARLSLGQLHEWRDGLTSTSAVDVGFEHVPKFTKLDAFAGGIGTEVRQKFGFGAYTPVATLDLGLHRREARLSGDDGWTARAGVSVGKRLTESWRLAATGDWMQHYGRSSIFDTRHHRVFATITWDITDRLQLSHGNGRLWGDFTANASAAVWARALAGGAGANIAAYYNTLSWTATDSFGPGWVTYRPSGHVSFWWLELSPALGRNTSLPLRYESLFSVNRVGVKYRQEVWSVQLLHRF